MTSKSKLHGGNNIMHTAGIFSDMTVDGPDIGTLVVVVDRAKNLPDRKIIGKQNPYCAARLGKEAKKTDTDHRGGQTPKWDQELRYTVHDSPDYYQLKVSVFNDDKKTDLIGETRIDLREIIVPGGGQNDFWHNLNCKGKYAGEIRVEITYYDTRQKQEKPEAFKPGALKMTDLEASINEVQRETKQHKNLIKRRPLPSDPVIRESSPGMSATSSFPYNPELETVDHISKTCAYTASPSPIYEHSSTDYRRYQNQNSVARYEGRHNSFPRDQLRTPNSGSGYAKSPSYGFQAVSSTEDYERVQATRREFQDSGYFSPQLPYSCRENNLSGYFSLHGNNIGRLNTNSNSPEAQKIVSNSASQRSLNGHHSYPETRAPQSESRDNFYPREKSGSSYIPYTKPYDYPCPEDLGAPPSLSDSPPPPPIHRSTNSNKYRVSLDHTSVPYVVSEFTQKQFWE
ncbi:Ingression protein fic1 [Erysiphe necator]|nr:Ingression protein fic1 [Erysiphe necator]